jgi:hypothetical protein
MDRKQLIKFLFAAAAVLGITLLYYFKDARVPGFFPQCPFHFITGLFCPGCGSQRAVSSLLHGEIMLALNYNVLLVASLPLIIYAAIISLITALANKPVRQNIFYSPVFARWFLAAVIIFWVVRNIPVYPCNLFAP